MKRPKSDTYWFYGYPTIERIEKGHYLVILTDALKSSEGLEKAEIY